MLTRCRLLSTYGSGILPATVSAHHHTQQLLVSEPSRAAIISINRAAQMNSLSQATMDELAATLRRLRQHASLRAIIITGAGGIFSAGADLNEVGDDALACACADRSS